MTSDSNLEECKRLKELLDEDERNWRECIEKYTVKDVEHEPEYCSECFSDIDQDDDMILNEDVIGDELQ